MIFKRVPEGSSNIPFENAMNGFEGTQEGHTTRGLKGLFTFKTLKTTDWVVASVVPSAEAFGPIEDLFYKMIWISVLLMLVMVPLMWGFVGRLVRPLGLLAQSMHETAAKMRDGHSVAPIAALGSKEIKTVADMKGMKIRIAGFAGECHLDQAELGPIGPLAQKFGINGNKSFRLGSLAKGGKVFCGGNRAHRRPFAKGPRGYPAPSL